MIAAVKRGIAPVGGDRDELRSNLYRTLITSYRDSYRAKEALRNLQVAAMVAQRS